MNKNCPHYEQTQDEKKWHGNEKKDCLWCLNQLTEDCPFEDQPSE